MKILNESRDYDLYHATTLKNLVSIINSDKLYAMSPYFVSDNKVIYGICLSRNYNFVSKEITKNDAIIVFDSNKLSNNYKLISRGLTHYGYKSNIGKNNKAEEFLYIGDSQSDYISNLQKYIKKILVSETIESKYNLIQKLEDEGFKSELIK